MKQLRITFNGNWVLNHRNDEELPIPSFIAEISKLNSIQVKNSSHNSLILQYDEVLIDANTIKSTVEIFLNIKYNETDIESLFEIEEMEIAEKTEANKTADVESTEENSESTSTKVFCNTQSKPKISAMDKINNLVGASEFKALASEINSVADEIVRTDTREIFKNMCYLFSIEDGCGCSTYVELLTELVKEKALCELHPNPIKEVLLDQYEESFKPFDYTADLIDSCLPSAMKVICVDIREWMDKTDNQHFRRFLRVIEKNAEKHICIFRVPFVEKDLLSRIQYSLSDLLNVKTISFSPLSQDEIKSYAESELKRFNYSVTEDSWEYFFQRIREEKSDGKFYGFNTVRKVIRELVYNKHVSNAQKEEKSQLIDEYDTMCLCANKDSLALSGMEQLESFVGVEGIKQRVEEIIAQIELSLKGNPEDRPCIHMKFVGNPGTGKTTIARIIGKILKEKNLLRVGAFFEHAGRDFCGRYIGETAPKTASMCRDAYGSILFIDEAYSLYRGGGDTKDYGREAIDTLIAEMENHRNDFVVIMAGYTKDIETLMSGNSGLASRMPYTIEFPNFSREQLYEIFVSMVKRKFKYSENLFDAVHDFFINLPDSVINARDFSNARYVRNLFERTWAKASLRRQLNGEAEIVLCREDFELAKADKEFAFNEKKTRIGF